MNTQETSERSLQRREFVLCAMGISVLMTGALVDAALNQRLDDPERLDRDSASLLRIPMKIGEWVASPGTIEDREQRVAGINGYIRREYRHQKTGYKVTMTILNGRSGPMSVHPPTACFEGVGYTLVSGPTVVTIKGRSGDSATLNRAAFRHGEGFSPETVRAFWGWSIDGHWDAPANPRLTYRGQPGLFKIYVTDQSPSGSPGVPQAESFLDEALSVIRHSLGGTDSLRRIPGSPEQVIGNSDQRQSAETAVPGKVAERQ